LGQLVEKETNDIESGLATLLLYRPSIKIGEGIFWSGSRSIILEKHKKKNILEREMDLSLGKRHFSVHKEAREEGEEALNSIIHRGSKSKSMKVTQKNRQSPHRSKERRVYGKTAKTILARWSLRSGKRS